MFEGIRSLLGFRPRRSEADEKLDRALASTEALDHYFFFSDQLDLEGAAKRLQQRGWTVVSVTFHEEEKKHLLHMRQHEKPDDLKELQTELDLLADDFHGEYDGWQVPGFIDGL